jgi:hypothetical protein
MHRSVIIFTFGTITEMDTPVLSQEISPETNLKAKLLRNEGNSLLDPKLCFINRLYRILQLEIASLRAIAIHSSHHSRFLSCKQLHHKA